MENLKRKKILGWIAVGISAVFANLWAFWGIIENFHEGWYFESFWSNLIMMFGQYLLMPIGFMLLALISIKWNKIGAFCHLLLALGAIYLFGGKGVGLLFVGIPFIGLAALYWFGGFEKKGLAYILISALPLLQIIGIGTFLSIKVSNRFNDGNFSERIVVGNNIQLTWAPQGPGWPDNGVSWEEAKKICAHLNEDGKSLNDKEVNIWRLPTVDEAVRSMAYHGNNAGGAWDSLAKKASYKIEPDKESPLWNVHLKTIYWWTATEVNADNAYIVVYDGGIWPRIKKLKAGYLNFRAVKNVMK
jgi:hypothetical protein